VHFAWLGANTFAHASKGRSSPFSRGVEPALRGHILDAFGWLDEGQSLSRLATHAASAVGGQLVGLVALRPTGVISSEPDIGHLMSRRCAMEAMGCHGAAVAVEVLAAAELAPGGHGLACRADSPSQYYGHVFLRLLFRSSQ
jgi:hypothetical protein